MSKPSAQEYAQALYDQLLETPVKKRDHLVSDFVKTVDQHEQSGLSEDIIQSFQELAQQKENSIEIELVSSIPLHNLVFLSHKISSDIKKNVEIKNFIKADLIGGVILYYKDYKIDFSLKKILSQSISSDEDDFVCMDEDLKKIISILNKNKDLFFDDEKPVTQDQDIEIVRFTAKEKPDVSVLEKQLSAALLKKVIINYNQDPSVIAGAIIEYDHHKIDTTIDHKLKE